MGNMIRQALARGYCTKGNENKTVDATLIEAMGVEVDKVVAKLQKENEELRTQNRNENTAKQAYHKRITELKKRAGVEEMESIILEVLIGSTHNQNNLTQKQENALAHHIAMKISRSILEGK